MLRRIAIPVDHRGTTLSHVPAALALAQAHDAEAVGIYADDATQLTLRDSVLTAPMLQELSRLAEAAENKARRAFEQAAAAAGARATWRADLRHAQASVIAHARQTDLIVLPQSRVPGERASSFTEQLILDAGKPALVIPSSTDVRQIGQRVLYCWDQSNEAARALSDALPLLRQAHALAVLTMDDKRPEHDRDAEAAWPDLQAYCAAHGVPAPQLLARETRGVGIGATILNTAADQGADLIVMGAYGHSRLREWVLGGATIAMLREMTVPVLFSR